MNVTALNLASANAMIEAALSKQRTKVSSP